MTIRDEAVGDQSAVHEVQALAFRRPAEAMLVNKLRRSGDAVISLVAADSAVILGQVLLSRLRAPMRALALTPIGVRPGFRRQGIGSALIREGLERSRRDGWEAIFVLGDPGYYSRFGFSVDAAKGYICPYSGEHLMILALGRGKIPTDGDLVYPPPFESLD